MLNKLHIRALFILLALSLLMTFSFVSAADDVFDGLPPDTKKGLRPSSLFMYDALTDVSRLITFDGFFDGEEYRSNPTNVQNSDYQNLMQINLIRNPSSASAYKFTVYQMPHGETASLFFDNIYLDWMNYIVDGEDVLLNDVLGSLGCRVTSQALENVEAILSYKINSYTYVGGYRQISYSQTIPFADQTFEFNFADFLEFNDIELGSAIGITDIVLTFDTAAFTTNFIVDCSYSEAPQILEFDEYLSNSSLILTADSDGHSFVDSMVGWVDGFLDMQILEGFTLRTLLTLVVCIGGFILFLKLFSGG